jgi:hypothetical protein
MTMRTLSLMRPEIDLIILMKHDIALRQWETYKDILGLRDSQVIWTSGENFHIDDDIDDDVLRELIERIQSAGAATQWVLTPYAVHAKFVRWSGAVLALPNVSLFGEAPEWTAQFGDKSILHRHIKSLDTPAVIDTIDAEIVVARGYVCESTEELLHARKLLQDVDVVLKPIHGASGVGILISPDQKALEEYTFPIGAVNLEEKLNLDLDDNGEATLNISFHTFRYLCNLCCVCNH